MLMVAGVACARVDSVDDGEEVVFTCSSVAETAESACVVVSCINVVFSV